MARGRRNRKLGPELRVVFDTSVVFTESPIFLLRHKVREFVEKNSAHPELPIKWFMPDTVLEERRYQMRKEANKLLPPIRKLERLTRKVLEVDESVLGEAVEKATNEELDSLSIEVVRLDTTRVDWPQIIQDAVLRRPPFEAGEEKEKGFRDALVAQTFHQLVAASPLDSHICRIVFVCGDDLLRTAAMVGMGNAMNVEAPVTLEELGGLINAILGQISENLLARLRPKAETFFFLPEDSESLFFQENIPAIIEARFREDLARLPEGSHRRENGPWIVQPPNFAKREGGRFYWISPITMRQVAYRLVPGSAVWSSGAWNFQSPSISALATGVYSSPSSFSLSAPVLGSYLSSTSSSWQTPLSPGITSSIPPYLSWQGSVPSIPPRELPFALGNTKFEVEWSAGVSRKLKLSSRKIGEIRLVETRWE